MSCTGFGLLFAGLGSEEPNHRAAQPKLTLSSDFCFVQSSSCLTDTTAFCKLAIVAFC